MRSMMRLRSVLPFLWVSLVGLLFWFLSELDLSLVPLCSDSHTAIDIQYNKIPSPFFLFIGLSLIVSFDSLFYFISLKMLVLILLLKSVIYICMIIAIAIIFSFLL